jgi:hypothetical protein
MLWYNSIGDYMLLTERYKEQISGILGCFDRVIIRGTPGLFAYADGITSLFNAHKWKIFDFADIFKPVTDGIIENIKQMAANNNVEIEYIRKVGAFRKEDKVGKILEAHGNKPGLVHIFSQLELCNTYDPWHDKQNKKTYFKYAQTKRLCYYIYFMDKTLGLCYIKVPTVAPFGLMFYFNGHNLLENKLICSGIEYIKHDNAFVSVGDYEVAQKLSDVIDAKDIHKILDGCANRWCPLPKDWNISYQWSLAEVEYSLDVIFKDAGTLKPLYDNIIETAMHTITPENIANFLGKRFSLQFEGEAGSRYNKRILGTRIKHQLGDTSVKVYDKFGSILRIEVTSNNVSEMRVFRPVQKRNGATVSKMAPVKKSIYSLFDLVALFKKACYRYLETISSFDDPSDGLKKLNAATETIEDNSRKYRGFNFFSETDKKILLVVANPKFFNGMRNKHLRHLLPGFSSNKISRLFKNLTLRGLLEKVRRTNLYRLTSFGKDIITAGFKAINMLLVPQLALS